MKPIRHLIAIVFLLCGLSARGSEKVYDRDDMVGTYKCSAVPEFVLDVHLHADNTFMVVCNESYKRFGKWEVADDKVLLHFDELVQNPGQSSNELDQYVTKGLEIIDKNNLFWGYFLQNGHEKRVDLQRSDGAESSSKRKANKVVWKDILKEVIKEVID